jgi:predicted GNAT family acetyltransferase
MDTDAHPVVSAAAGVWHRRRVLRVAGARLLDDRDRAGVRAALDSDPVAACMVAARVEIAGLDPWRLGGEVWAVGSRLDGLCFSGANLVPLRGDRQALRSFAERARRHGRGCSSVVGRAELVLPLWEDLSAELDRYLPAAVAMFTEEVGVDPRAGDGGAGYRSRVAELVAAGRAFARFEGDEVVFKAEIGALSSQVGQIQGVWVNPVWRGHGLGTAGTAAVAERLAAIGRISSLYVNGFNHVARSAYKRIGFTQVGSFATVLF